MIGDDDVATVVQAFLFELVAEDGTVVASLGPDPSTPDSTVLLFPVPAGLGLDPDWPARLGKNEYRTAPTDPPYGAGITVTGYYTPGVGLPAVEFFSNSGYSYADIGVGRASVRAQDVFGGASTVAIEAGPVGSPTTLLLDPDTAGPALTLEGYAVEVWGPWTALPLAANWSAWDASRTPQYRRSYQPGDATIGRLELAGLVRRDTIDATAVAAYTIADLTAAGIAPAAPRYNAAMTSAGFGSLTSSGGNLALNVTAAHPGVPAGGYVSLDGVAWNLDGAP